jgi:hypothetical protein
LRKLNPDLEHSNFQQKKTEKTSLTLQTTRAANFLMENIMGRREGGRDMAGATLFGRTGPAMLASDGMIIETVVAVLSLPI